MERMALSLILPVANDFLPLPSGQICPDIRTVCPDGDLGALRAALACPSSSRFLVRVDRRATGAPGSHEDLGKATAPIPQPSLGVEKFNATPSPPPVVGVVGIKLSHGKGNVLANILEPCERHDVLEAAVNERLELGLPEAIAALRELRTAEKQTKPRREFRCGHRPPRTRIALVS